MLPTKQYDTVTLVLLPMDASNVYSVLPLTPGHAPCAVALTMNANMEGLTQPQPPPPVHGVPLRH